MVAQYVLDLDVVDATQIALVGGKGAHLGELSRIEGLGVPAGFCITTEAYRRIADAVALDELLEHVSRVDPGDRPAMGAISAAVRRTIERVRLPEDLGTAIADALSRWGDRAAYAVRSSATAEDLPTASFAGQHDTSLNLVGYGSIVQGVTRCWASLFSERAVAYRTRNRIDHRRVLMAVVVQRMVAAQASGVMFTADPITSNRRVVVIESALGLGEAFVSGRVDADAYTVRDNAIIDRSVGRHGAARGSDDRRRPALTDAQALQLAALGRRVEAHLGSPQDIEWCIADGAFHIVQSRPITTLFPIPKAPDRENHVYVSVGHQQMMTDPMRPLGISMWMLTTRAPMQEAGGRLFIDVTAALATPTSRAGVLDGLGKSDPLIRDALQSVLDRGDFIATTPDDRAGAPPAVQPLPAIETDPAVVERLIAERESSLAVLKRDISKYAGAALIEFVLADIAELQRLLFDPRSHQVILSALEATWWLEEHLSEWLGERKATDVLTQSVPHNVTSEMGLALLDVADVVRPHAEVVAFLHGVDHDDFLERMATLEGGPEAGEAIRAFLERYGMRCVGEIDITRPRWREVPGTLVPLILANIKNFGPGAGARRFEHGRRAALAKEHEILERLRGLSEGEQKAARTKAMIDRVRTFIGYREHPKYAMVGRYFVYKQALLDEAARLVQSRVLRAHDDIYYLSLHELHDVVKTNRADHELIRQRRAAFRSYHALTPPRVLTSDGEAVSGAYRRDDVPNGALVGLAVSAGTIEGRARVILDLADADLEPGDILVTAFTDPSWTPMFVSVVGLVTEVGGLMTHGAVIAREYGLPAVVGVEHATRRIVDGQRIRVHGTDGYVEILSPTAT